MTSAATAEIGLPPGPRMPRPLQTLAWITRPGPFMERMHGAYGDAFTLRIAHEGTWVFLVDPDDVKRVFTGDPSVLHAGEGNVILRPLLGHHSVLLLDEQQHMSQRKLLLPPFHGERMQRYRELLLEIANAEIDRWPITEPFELRPRMQAITLELIIRAVFGVTDEARVERLRTRLAGMLDWAGEGTSMLVAALMGPERAGRLGVFRRVVDPVDELVHEEIEARRRADDLDERDDVLSMLLQARHEDGTSMSDVELRDELLTLLVAGHETTATALAWAFERLLRHPDKLDRLRDEVAAGEDTYLDAVAKETLRLRPVLPIVVRRLTEPFEVAGHRLPAGVSVAPCIYLIHRRPDVYPEPRRFLPERFLERPAGTYTWIPFGGGVRRCLGATFAVFELKTVLAAVVSRARLRPAVPAGERITRRAITLVPERGSRVVAERVAAPARELREAVVP